MMDGLLAQIIPIGLLGAIVPTRIIISILLLTSDKPMRHGLAYLVGLAGLYLAVGLIVLISFGAEFGSSLKFSTTISGTILAVLGIFLLIFGLRGLFIADPDPDAAPPGWMRRVKTISTGQAFLLGVILACSIRFLMIFLSGVTIIYDAPVRRSEKAIVLLVLIALMLLGQIIPTVLYAINPKRASGQLQTVMDWLNQHNRVIMTVLSLALGAIFLVIGLNDLSLIPA
jgi:hypothetical protein